MVKKLLLVLVIGLFISVGVKTIVSWDSIINYMNRDKNSDNSNLILDLEHERRGEYEYIYGYPKGNEHYGDTLVIDLVRPFDDDRWIEGG